MANLSSYVVLRFAYFLSFEKVNNIFDETIIKIMRVTSLSIGAATIVAEIMWKMSSERHLLSMIPFYVFLGGPDIKDKRNPGPVKGLEKNL